MDEKSTWSPEWYAKDNVFTVSKILHQVHLKEVGLTQKWKTMTLQNLTTFDFLLCRRPT